MRIDPISLRLFVAVIDTGTIGAAAHREHIAASALSRRLRDLEERLGARLVVRSNRGVEPTAAGLEVLRMARSVLRDLDHIAGRFVDPATGDRGPVRVFANVSTITGFLPDTLRGFLARHPGIDVQLHECISSAVLQGVAANAADVGLYADGPDRTDGLHTQPWRRDELALAVPVEHPLASRREVTIVEALRHEFVGLHAGSTVHRRLLQAARETGLPLRCRIHVTGFDALSRMVEAGLGVAVLPRAIGLRYERLQGLRIVTLAESWAWRDIRLCVRALDTLPVAARRFVDHLIREAESA